MKDAAKNNPVWIELIQLVPIVTLALPFILAGRVDVANAGPGFLIGALLAAAVTALVLARGHVLNPILVGSNAWLVAGALAISLPITRLRDWLATVQGFGLFVAILLVGVVATLTFPHGYVGWRSPDRAWQRRASLILLGLSAVAVGWSWAFRHDIRLGGGLPFIVLNVARRAMARRAPVLGGSP